jgi:hypothetical protein
MSFKYIGHAAACLVFAVAPGLVLANEFPVVNSCVGPVEFDGRHYELVSFDSNTTDRTWGTANTAAMAREFEDTGVMGHLATITSEAEDRFVEALRRCALGRGTNKLLKNAVWVGGEQVAPFGPLPGDGWQWVNGEGPISTPDARLPSYSNWLKNPDGTRKEPNNTGGNERHLTVGHTNLFGWNDEGNLGNVGGYIVEYDTSSTISVIKCIEGGDAEGGDDESFKGCQTTAGQTLLLPPGVDPDGSIGVRTYEFIDPRALSLTEGERCGEKALTLFQDRGADEELKIPAYLCGSPRFLVVEIEKDVEIRQGTVFIENEPLVALPGNWYECDGQTFENEPPLLLGDPQARDVVAWQATRFEDMLEDRIGPGEDSQFVGALGEFTFDCGSSRGLTRNLSYLVIGMHINFGDTFQGNPDFVNRRFVDLTGYKLQLLQESVRLSEGVLDNGDFTSMRALVRNAIRYHGRGDFDEALEKIEVFLQKVDEAIYADSLQNYNGEHLARGNNIKFMYEEKVIPFAP